MRTVWKHRLSWPSVDLRLSNPKVVHVGIDPATPGDDPCVWIEHDPYSSSADIYKFTFIGTGHPVPEGMGHVGSTITATGLVWHVYWSGG